MAKAQGPVQNLGPTGERVAENLRRIRGSMPYRELADRLADLGRPIPVLGLSRIESKARRVDADDLVALAAALNVSPATLLLPPEDPDDDLGLTAEYSTSWQAAWRWATGEQPLTDDAVPLTDDRVQAYVRENRPYERTPFIREAARLFLSREPNPPWTVKIHYDGVRPPYQSFTYGPLDRRDDDGER